MTYETDVTASARETELRERAVKQLKKKRDFRGHLLMYTLVNAFLVLVWAVTSGTDGFFWPVFSIAGWGIGVIANWYDAYRGGDFGEDDIQHEMDRLAHLR